MLRLSLPEEETAEEETPHPLNCRALQPTNDTRSGLNLPHREEPPTSLPAALDKFVEISQDIMRRIDSLTAEVEQLREQTSAARRKRRKLATSTSAPQGGSATTGDETSQIQQAAGQQQVHSDLRRRDGCDVCKQPEEAKSRRCCGVCGTPGHNARTCQTQPIVPVVESSTEDRRPWLMILDN
jgi:hypothetical protein